VGGKIDHLLLSMLHLVDHLINTSWKMLETFLKDQLSAVILILRTSRFLIFRNSIFKIIYRVFNKLSSGSWTAFGLCSSWTPSECAVWWAVFWCLHRELFETLNSLKGRGYLCPDLSDSYNLELYWSWGIWDSQNYLNIVW
jgi:hypothetical protein